MRTKVTLVLLFLNVALFFFIFGFEREWRVEKAALQARRLVLGSEIANIQQIQISGPNLAEPVMLRRTTDGWLLTSPFEWPANTYAVNRIMNELQFLYHETSFAVQDLAAAGQTLADYGLENPALTVTLTPASPSGEASATPTPVVLAIGAETAVGNRLYVLSPDQTRVHVVQRSLADSLRVSLDALRALTCFTIHTFEVRSLNLHQTAGPANVRVRLRREGNRWSFEAPIVARADKTQTEMAINDLNALQTRQFLGSARAHPELAVQAGTTNPSLRITLEGNNRRETLLLGNPVDPNTVAASGPAPAEDEQVFHAQMEDRDAVFTVAIPTELLNDLRNAQEELRDRRILPLDGREVTSITIAAPGRPPLTLQRLEPPTRAQAASATPASWQIVRSAGPGPQTMPADGEIVRNLLQFLGYLTAEKFERDVPSDAELEDWGLHSRPQRTLTLTLEPDSTSTAPSTLTLLIGVNSNNDLSSVYAKLANQSFVYVISSEILRRTPVVPWVFRDRLLRDLSSGTRIAGLNLTELASGNVIYQRTLGDGETWEQVFSQEPPERAAALTALRSQMRTLRAQRFVSDHFTETVLVQGENRAWAYRLEVTLGLTGGPTEQLTTSQLFFAPRTGGGTQLVGSPEFDVIFEAEQPLLDALWALTYGPRDPGPAALPPAPTPDTSDDQANSSADPTEPSPGAESTAEAPPPQP